MKRIAELTKFVSMAAVLILLNGCTNTGQKSNAQAKASPKLAPSANASAMLNDPCDERMQDIAGLMLMYLNTHPNLPESLDALRAEPGFEDVKEFVCPTSHQPYIYNPTGLFCEAGILVMYDATPVHNGQRWAIAIAKPTGKQPLMAKVIAVKESVFQKK